MNRIVVLLVIIGIHLIRGLKFDFKKSSRYLFISFFVTTIPFQITFTLFNPKLNTSSGTIGNILLLNIPIFLYLYLLITKRGKIGFKASDFGFWSYILLLLFVISFINPLNYGILATFVAVFFFVSHLLLFNFFIRNFTIRELLMGVYEGFRVLTYVQLILTICFPVLGIKSVVNLFYSAAEIWSTRMDTRVGAVGVFPSPGNLGLFMLIVCAFFFICWLKKYRNNESLLLSIVSVFVIVMTFSRTTFLVLGITLITLYFVNKYYNKKILTVYNIFRIITPLALFVYWLIFLSPLSDTFLKSDVDDMYSARMIHNYMAFEAFNDTPIIGVGINSHLDYFDKKSSIVNSITTDTFFSQNPIHNIHSIVLVENGIIGFIVWVVFLVLNISKAKSYLSMTSNSIFQLLQISIILIYTMYGLTGWAPFSPSILPFFLLINFIALKQRAGLVRDI